MSVLRLPGPDPDESHTHHGDINIRAEQARYQPAETHHGDVNIHAEHVTLAAPTYPGQHEVVRDISGYDLRPDPLSATSPAQFMELLRQYRLWCGEPSYRDMAKACGHTYAASTLCTALNKNKLPKQRLLHAIIYTCGGDDTDIQAWTTAWRRITLHATPRSIPAAHHLTAS